MPSSKPLYGLLGVYIPFSVLILWSTILGVVIRRFVSPLSLFYIFNERVWCTTGFVSALAATCYAGLMKKTHQRHSAADLRGSIIAAAAAYVFVSLFRRDVEFARRFIPCIDSIAAALAALYAWYSAISFREIFSGIELFESFMAQHRGEHLRAAMWEYAPEMSQTSERLKNLQLSYGAQIIIPSLLIGALGFAGHSLLFILLVFFIFTAGFLLMGFLRLIRRELIYASEGISLSVRDRVQPVTVMALGIGAAAVLSLVGSSDASLLPPGLIFGLLAWLVRLLASLFRPSEPVAFTLPERSAEPMMMNPSQLFPESEMESAGLWAGWTYIKYGFIAVLVFLFLLFMIYPLLKRSGYSLSLGKIGSAIARWFGELKRNIHFFLTALTDRGVSQKYRPDSGKLRSIASELLSGIKKREIKRSVNLFARLILWGIETVGVSWKPSHAPGEYCGILAAAVAQRAASSPESPPSTETAHSGEASKGVDSTEICKNIIRSGELFEKALYSARPLSAGEEREFKRIVENITGL
jgi:hypothetical protein